MNRALPYILLFAFVGCSSSISPWEYDDNFTFDLLFNNTCIYEGNLVDSVDVIQIYLPPEEKRNHVLSLRVLRSQPQGLVGELRNKEAISDFFQSFQKVVNHVDGTVCSYADSPAVHIVAFDSKLMRVAYFRYYLCSVNGTKYGKIIPLRDECVVCNTSPPAFLVDKLRRYKWGPPVEG